MTPIVTTTLVCNKVDDAPPRVTVCVFIVCVVVLCVDVVHATVVADDGDHDCCLLL